MLRFAPSPTGDMHIGNLRVAIFNYIVSIKQGEILEYYLCSGEVKNDKVILNVLLEELI